MEKEKLQDGKRGLERKKKKEQKKEQILQGYVAFAFTVQ